MFLTNNKRLVGFMLICALLLLVPFIAMFFTNEVNWKLSDFIIAGGLLFGTSLITDFVIRKVQNVNSRIAILLLIGIALFLIWIELAVGLFGTVISGS